MLRYEKRSISLCSSFSSILFPFVASLVFLSASLPRSGDAFPNLPFVPWRKTQFLRQERVGGTKLFSPFLTVDFPFSKSYSFLIFIHISQFFDIYLPSSVLLYILHLHRLHLFCFSFDSNHFESEAKMYLMMRVTTWSMRLARITLFK